MRRSTGRLLTKLIVLIPIGLVVFAIYRLEQRWNTAPPDAGIVYITPTYNTPAPVPPR